jgi:hypothetical protein
MGAGKERVNQSGDPTCHDPNKRQTNGKTPSVGLRMSHPPGNLCSASLRSILTFCQRTFYPQVLPAIFIL